MAEGLCRVSQAPKNHDDPRLAEMLEVIFKFAAGDLNARGTLADDDSALDGVMVGINVLGEELSARLDEARQARGALEQALEYAQTLIRSSPDGILAVDLDLRITEWNPMMERFCDKLRSEVVGRLLEDLPFMQQTGETARIMAGMDGKATQPTKVTYRHPGTVEDRFYETFTAPLRDTSGEILGALLRVRDITESKKAEDELRLASLYQRSLIEAGLDPLVTINNDGRITDVNAATVEATGVARELLLGNNFSNYFTDPAKAYAGYMEAFATGSVRNLPLTMRHASGKLTNVLYNASVYRDGQGGMVGVLAVTRDITERENAREAEELARHDGLTDLFNQRAFFELLREETSRAQRFKHSVSLLMLDIDHFKHVNDTYGHPVGDLVLKGLSDLLKKQARVVDRVCRYGGEEFMVILPETEAAAAMQIAERLRAEVEYRPFGMGGGKVVNITVSIGVSTYPQQADTPEAIVRASDTALYDAKRAGRNRVSRYAR